MNDLNALDSRRGDDLVRRILAGDRDEMLGYHLLQEVFIGYPISQIAMLLRSGEPAAVEAGAFVVSELGSGAAPLAAEFQLLLAQGDVLARAAGIDAVLVNSAVCDGPTIGDAASLVIDQHPGVRAKAMRMLAVIPMADLRRSLESIRIPAVHAQMLWLTADQTEDALAISALERLGAIDPVTLRFATIAAQRVATATDEPLRRAARSTDPEIRDFAEFELGLIAMARDLRHPSG
jgi:hypothetical protein